MTKAHEPRRGPGAHLSTEDLSALADGAQPGAEGAQAHLRDCPDCRVEVDTISDLLAALAEFDAPPLPPEVAIRIDAALVREAAARAEAPPSALDSVFGSASGSESSLRTATGRDSSSGRKRRGIPRGLGWGLASLALVAGGLTLFVNLSSSSSGSAPAASSNGKVQDSATSPGSPGALAAPQFGSTAPQTLAAATPLAMLVKELLPTRAAETTPGSNTPPTSPCLADPRFASLAAAQALAAANRTFEGTAATIVVYPNRAANGTENAAEPATVLAVVYVAPCTTSSYRILTEGIVLR